MSPPAHVSENSTGRPTPQPPSGWVDCGAVARNKQLVRYIARAETPADPSFVIKHRPPVAQVPQARFDREGELMRQLNGTSGVIAIEQFDDQLPARWFIMPRAELLGGHLGPEPHLRDVVAAVKVIADTLASVADRFGTAHRDIKPANLLWLDMPLVADFGIAQIAELSDLTRAGEKVGPYEFLAPEMRETAADTDGKPADVWSLAKTLFALVHVNRSTWPPVGTLTAERSEFSLRPAGSAARIGDIDDGLPEGRAGRMSLCQSRSPRSSATTS